MLTGFFIGIGAVVIVFAVHSIARTFTRRFW